ncbi:MAG: hypothetical protein ACP5OS_05045 [Leptospirillia bacterium]
MRRPSGASPLLLAGVLLLAACSGNTNSSGPAAPLPTGQTGSIAALSNPGNCYISDPGTACSTPYKGTNSVTALATGVSGTTHTIYVGDSAGNLSAATVSSTTPPTTIQTCTAPGAKILAMASNGTTLLYATSGGISSSSCTSTSAGTNNSVTPSITTASGLTYNASAGEFVGVTSNATSFTCTTASCTTPAPLSSLLDTSPNITAIASDPTQPIVYILSIGSSTNRIYSYYVSGSTLTYLGNYSGTELNYPAGIALFQGANPTQNSCTSGSCTFMDVTNTGNATVTQYVLTYSGSGAQTSVSINQFNNAYFDCDLINSAAIAAFPTGTNNLLPQPDLFVGEQGTSYGSCMGTSSTLSYGNNVTAYTVTGE